MKIQQLIEREPFGEILERTLSKFLNNYYGGDYHVKWYERYRSSDGSNGSKEQIWHCNPELNVIFTANADSGLLQSVRSQYSHTPFPWRRMIQKRYVALATHPNLATWFTRSAIGIMPAIPDGNKLIMVGGNNRIRLIYPEQGKVFSVLKDGFDPAYIEREVSVRQRKGDWPIPELLGYGPDFTWFEERYVDGLALNRLSSEADRSHALREAVSVLSHWLKCSQTEVKALDYAEEVTEAIRGRITIENNNSPIPPLVKGVQGGFESEVLDWLKLISKSLQGLVHKGGDTLQLALGHGDFQPGNILLDGNHHLWLIDWEHSARRQVVYDGLVYSLASRFPKGLTERIESFLFAPDKFLGQPLTNVCPGLDTANPARLRLHLVVFLLEELAWYLEENHNPLFRKQSGGWLAFKQEINQALAILEQKY